MTSDVTGTAVEQSRAMTVEVAGRTVTSCRLGGGEPLLYLHGLCDVHSAGTPSEPPLFLARLAEQRHVIAPALPGYPGSSGLEEIEDVEDCAWQLVDLLDALDLTRVDIVAHSLGGWFAAELALRHPGRVRRLALVAPLGLHVRGVEVPAFFGAVAPRGVGGMGEARRLLFADPDGDAATWALPDEMSRDAQLRWFGGLAGAARLGWRAPHFQSRQLARRLGRITTPVLVVGGHGDLLVPPVVARAWSDGLDAARRVEIAAAGHCIPLEQPDSARHVLAFLSDPGVTDASGNVDVDLPGVTDVSRTTGTTGS